MTNSKICELFLPEGPPQSTQLTWQKAPAFLLAGPGPDDTEDRAAAGRGTVLRGRDGEGERLLFSLGDRAL